MKTIQEFAKFNLLAEDWNKLKQTIKDLHDRYKKHYFGDNSTGKMPPYEEGRNDAQDHFVADLIAIIQEMDRLYPDEKK